MKVILWDFDGTLGQRDGMWGGALLEVLDARCPGHRITREHLRPHLRTGFPWHTPAVAHPDLCTPGRWWARLEPTFERAYGGVGIDADLAKELAAYVRPAFCQPVHWRLFDDVLPTLALLRAQGWSHHILSNHVPELPQIAAQLGLSAFVDVIHNSADTGFEKPHPEAFRLALRSLPAGTGAEVWMVGDNPDADIRGAAAAGIPGVLVRKPCPGVKRYCESVAGVPAWLQRGR